MEFREYKNLRNRLMKEELTIEKIRKDKEKVDCKFNTKIDIAIKNRNLTKKKLDFYKKVFEEGDNE